MAVTRVPYTSDNTAPGGMLLADAINDLIQGREKLLRWYNAAVEATDAGTTKANLEGGHFGAAAGKGDEMWDQAVSIKTLIDGDDAGGLRAFLASLDNGG